MMSDHHHWRKTCACEGSTRVPMIFACPDAWKDLPRAKDGKLVLQTDGTLTLLPNYHKWKERAAAIQDRG